MTRFHTVPRCPLTVQFWLYGLDARQGLLARRGFGKAAATRGSSVYTLGDLSLHSVGLTLRLPAGELPSGELHFNRRVCLFTLNGTFLPLHGGLSLCRPALADHEAWVGATLGPAHRTGQLRGHHLPPPVRRNVGAWLAYLGGAEMPADSGSPRAVRRQAARGQLLATRRGLSPAHPW